jgi:uncharacterized protein (TIGR02246 family)
MAFTPPSRFNAAILAGLLLLGGCTAPRTPVGPENDVLARLSLYEDGIRRMDFNQVADLFAPEGEVVNPGGAPVRGRETIRRFLRSFAGYKVVENTVRAESTRIDGSSAHQVGTYTQAVVVPGGTTVHVRGRFAADWQREGAGPWLLVRMATTPGP